MKYSVADVDDWFIVQPAGQAENNEPLRVRHLFRQWLAHEGVRVIVNLKNISELGVWEGGLLTSFKKEVDQRGGVLRLCHLNSALGGYFHNERFADEFDVYADLKHAMAAERS